MSRNAITQPRMRPLLLAAAVGFVCHSAYAQTPPTPAAPTLSTTPFANRPLHLQGESVSTAAPGVKPNIMLLIDDSGSMDAEVPGSGGKTRMRVTIDALNVILDSYGDKMRWNLYTFWGTENMSGALPGVKHDFMTAAQLRPYVNRLQALGGTPSARRYLEAARQLKDGIQYRCQKNYIVFMSDGDANGGGATYLTGLPILQPWETQLYGTFTADSPNWSEWWGLSRYKRWFGGQDHVYLTYDQGLGNGIAVFAHALKDADLRTGNGRDLEGGYWDKNTTDPNPVMRNTEHTKQNIQTFTIGFGGGLSSSGEGFLVDGATCGGAGATKAQKLGNCYFAATTGADLARAFDKIFETINSENQATPEQTYSSSTPTSTGSTIAELAATLTLDTGKWSSNLLFAKFDSNGNLTNTTESATYNNRRVLVNDGEARPNSIYWLDGSTPATKKIDFGIKEDNEFTKALIPWLIRDKRFSDAQIEAFAKLIPAANRTVSNYRVRAATANDPERQMGDVIGTPIVAMGQVSSADKRQKYVITAANDGMVYIFSKAGSVYDLALNYLPAGMQRESKLEPSNQTALTVGKSIKLTAEEQYGKNDRTNPHVFLNNGGISWARTPKTGGRNQQDILLGTMGQGGRGAYALTIAGKKRDSNNANTPAGLDANPTTWNTEVPLWETIKGQNNPLGYTISTAMIGQVATSWVNINEPKLDSGVYVYAFLANGYPASTGNIPYDASPTLYIYDMMGQEFGTSIGASSSSVSNGHRPGQLIQKISVPGSSRGALATPTLLDTNKDGIVEFAYAGDYQGGMYRFDLRGAPVNWKAHKIYQGPATQPITAAPALYKIKDNENKYVVVFGTGSDIYEADRQNTDQQVIMGIYDDLSNANPTTLNHTSSAILDQTMSTKKNSKNQDARYLTTNNFDDNVHKGWRIRLTPGNAASPTEITTSERVVVKPEILIRTAFLTTRIYGFKETKTTLPTIPGYTVDSKNTCYKNSSVTATGGTSWQMAIDVLTGSGPAAGSNSDNAKGSYFGFSDQTTPGTGGVNREVEAGFNYNSLASSSGVVRTSNVSANSLQVNAHGEVGTQGTIVATDKSDADLLKDLNKYKNCIPKGETYKLIVGTGATNASGGHNLVQTNLVGPICKDSLSRGNTLIRVDWRQIPL